MQVFVLFWKKTPHGSSCEVCLPRKIPSFSPMYYWKNQHILSAMLAMSNIVYIAWNENLIYSPILSPFVLEHPVMPGRHVLHAIVEERSESLQEMKKNVFPALPSCWPMALLCQCIADVYLKRRKGEGSSKGEDRILNSGIQPPPPQSAPQTYPKLLLASPSMNLDHFCWKFWIIYVGKGVHCG